MKLPRNSRMADEKAAIKQQHHQPPAAARGPVKTAPITPLRASVTTLMWAAIGVVAVLLLTRWLLRIW